MQLISSITVSKVEWALSFGQNLYHLEDGVWRLEKTQGQCPYFTAGGSEPGHLYYVENGRTEEFSPIALVAAQHHGWFRPPAPLKTEWQREGQSPREAWIQLCVELAAELASLVNSPEAYPSDPTGWTTERLREITSQARQHQRREIFSECVERASWDEDPLHQWIMQEAAQAAEIEHRRMEAALFQFLTKLSKRQREALLLAEEGHSYEEIASALGIGRETVKEHLQQVRKKIKRMRGR
jgi:RNA polymerase sigma factor (sigma-70 family)